MVKLKYTLRNDLLFKMVFTKFPNLLKILMSELLGIDYNSISQFEILNTEIPPEVFGTKFCRFDIIMRINGRLVNLEIQNRDQGNFVERSLFNWAREYSTALPMGEDYKDLPVTIVVSILNYNQFDHKEYHSEFHPLEVTHYMPLSDKMVMMYYELTKLPKRLDPNNLLELLLHLFAADTEADLAKIKKLEVSIMQEAIKAYQTVSNSAEFRELDRMLAKARHDEAQALAHAKEEGRVEGEKIGLVKGKEEGKREGRVEGKREGRVEGKREGTLAIAKNLLLINLPLDQIVKATGLTHEEVETLRDAN